MIQQNTVVRLFPSCHKLFVFLCFCLVSSAMTLSPTENSKSTHQQAVASRLVKNDVLFQCIEEMQGEIPFGSFLDAGTGLHSTRWIMTLLHQNSSSTSTSCIGGGRVTAFTAVTADETMQKTVEREVDELLGVLSIPYAGDNNRIVPEVVIGNWFPLNQNSAAAVGNANVDYPIPTDRQYDTILADYLIGAMDGFSPYRQDEMFDVLAKHLRPGGRLYIVGLEPLPDTITKTNSLHAEAENLLARVRQVRDACILLAGHRCYREYPLTWIVRQINKNNNQQFKLIGTKTFPILYRHETIVRQINVGRSKLKLMPTKQLATSMGLLLDQLEQESLRVTSKAPENRVQVGFDYVVAAERIHDGDENDEMTVSSS